MEDGILAHSSSSSSSGTQLLYVKIILETCLQGPPDAIYSRSFSTAG